MPDAVPSAVQGAVPGAVQGAVPGAVGPTWPAQINPGSMVGRSAVRPVPREGEAAAEAGLIEINAGPATRPAPGGATMWAKTSPCGPPAPRPPPRSDDVLRWRGVSRSGHRLYHVPSSFHSFFLLFFSTYRVLFVHNQNQLVRRTSTPIAASLVLSR